jgi:multicomponent Na+:H+ antiporter subunit G
MNEAVTIAGGALVLAGGLFSVLGAAGVLRFPDVYTRIHAASVTDTGAALLMILGFIVLSGFSLVTLKLVLLGVLLFLATATASHALANAAYGSGLWPWLGPFEVMRASDRSGDDEP